MSIKNKISDYKFETAGKINPCKEFYESLGQTNEAVEKLQKINNSSSKSLGSENLKKYSGDRYRQLKQNILKAKPMAEPAQPNSNEGSK